MGHGLQHHLVEGLGDEWGGQLPKVILEDACRHRALWSGHPWLLGLAGPTGVGRGNEEDRCGKVSKRPDRTGEVPEGPQGFS